MRAKDFITEAFDRPYAFNWSRGDHGDYDISVKLPDGSPLNIAFNHEGDNVWHVAFDRGHSQDITGEGDAQRIFATVLTSIQQFIIKQDPDRLYFSASKDVEPGQNSESRARLYERMVNRYAAAMGYDVVVDDRRGHTMFILDKDPTVAEDRHPNDTPYGPETKPTMPKGTVRVDVSDVYDWYKLGMHISDLDGLGKHDFGKGPPSTIFSFGDEETEHKYIKDLEKTGLTTTDIDPKDPNQPRGIKRQKVDPTFNVNESNDGKPSWYINSYDNFKTAFEIDLVVDGKDIGFFSYQYDPEQDTVENDVRIINDSERGHGYGKLLLLKAIETAQQHNLPYKRDHRGTSPAQNRVYSSLVDDGIIKIGYDKTITLTGKNLSTTKKKQPKFSLIAHGEYVGHFDDYEDAVREADRIANDPNSKYQMVMVKDNSSKEIVYEVWRGKDLNEEEFNGIDITMDVEGDEIMVTATGNGRELGHVLFVDQGEYLMPQDLEVDERFQGQGIAAAMYDYVKSKGYKIRRSGQQTDAGAGFWGKHRPEQNVWESTADDINKMFNNMYDPMTTNLQRVALMAMQGRQDEAVMQLNRVIKDASPEAQKKITDAVNNIKPVTVNGKIADSSTLDKSKQHQDWILNTFIPWVQSLLDKQGMTEEQQSKPTMGINVRSDGDIDYAGLIIDGQKKYESRQTDSLRPYVGKTVAIVRTGKGSAVAIGQVTVGEPVVVDAEKFDKMRDQHLVPQGSKFDIDPGATKYLYPMIDPVRWDSEKLVKQRGIVARKIDEGTKSTNHVLFLGPDAVIVGQEHGKPLKLSDQEQQKIRDIAERHGAWYEGNGMDRKLTAGIIDDYAGSWDDDLLSPAIKGYPAPFLYVLFSNIKENDTVEGKIGSDPDSTIFDRILDTQPSTNYFPDRKFDAETLQKFLKSVSEGQHDFVRMSQAPATKRNVRQFFELGEQLMWPNNWEEYPYRAGRVAKSVNDLRDKFLASRKRGVYVAGSDHLQAVQQFLDQNKQGVAEGKHPNQQVVNAIQKVLPVAQEIWFHGSRATGQHRRNSDTDILVVVPDDLVGDQYLGVVRILQKLSSHFDNYDIQPTKSGTNIHQIAQEEGKLLWSTTNENFADGKVKGKSRPGRVKRAGASCNGSVTDLRARAKKASGELSKMYHWCANMKSGRKK